MGDAVWVGGPQDGMETILPPQREYDYVTTIEKGAPTTEPGGKPESLPMIFGKAPVRPRKPNFTSNAKYGIYWNERHK